MPATLLLAADASEVAWYSCRRWPDTAAAAAAGALLRGLSLLVKLPLLQLSCPSCRDAGVDGLLLLSVCNRLAPAAAAADRVAGASRCCAAAAAGWPLLLLLLCWPDSWQFFLLLLLLQ